MAYQLKAAKLNSPTGFLRSSSYLCEYSSFVDQKLLENGRYKPKLSFSKSTWSRITERELLFVEEMNRYEILTDFFDTQLFTLPQDKTDIMYHILTNYQFPNKKFLLCKLLSHMTFNAINSNDFISASKFLVEAEGLRNEIEPCEFTGWVYVARGVFLLQSGSYICQEIDQCFSKAIDHFKRDIIKGASFNAILLWIQMYRFQLNLPNIEQFCDQIKKVDTIENCIENPEKLKGIEERTFCNIAELLNVCHDIVKEYKAIKKTVGTCKEYISFEECLKKHHDIDGLLFTLLYHWMIYQFNERCKEITRDIILIYPCATNTFIINISRGSRQMVEELLNNNFSFVKYLPIRYVEQDQPSQRVEISKLSAHSKVYTFDRDNKKSWFSIGGNVHMKNNRYFFTCSHCLSDKTSVCSGVEEMNKQIFNDYTGEGGKQMTEQINHPSHCNAFYGTIKCNGKYEAIDVAFCTQAANIPDNCLDQCLLVTKGKDLNPNYKSIKDTSKETIYVQKSGASTNTTEGRVLIDNLYCNFGGKLCKGYIAIAPNHPQLHFSNNGDSGSWVLTTHNEKWHPIAYIVAGIYNFIYINDDESESKTNISLALDLKTALNYAGRNFFTNLSDSGIGSEMSSNCEE